MWPVGWQCGQEASLLRLCSQNTAGASCTRQSSLLLSEGEPRFGNLCSVQQCKILRRQRLLFTSQTQDLCMQVTIRAFKLVDACTEVSSRRGQVSRASDFIEYVAVRCV